MSTNIDATRFADYRKILRSRDVDTLYQGVIEGHALSITPWDSFYFVDRPLCNLYSKRNGQHLL